MFKQVNGKPKRNTSGFYDFAPPKANFGGEVAFLKGT
jgi:hypothetical protein